MQLIKKKDIYFYIGTYEFDACFDTLTQICRHQIFSKKNTYVNELRYALSRLHMKVVHNPINGREGNIVTLSTLSLFIQ